MIAKAGFQPAYRDQFVQPVAREARNDRTGEYLLGIPLISDYLEEALSQFGESCDE